MKFWEAMKALEEGSTIRCTHPNADNYPFHRSQPIHRWAAIKCLGSLDWEWEIYQEPEKLLSFSEVVKGLKEGKKFRRKIWKYPYVSLNEDLVTIYGPYGSSSTKLSIVDFEATDWIEVHE